MIGKNMIEKKVQAIPFKKGDVITVSIPNRMDLKGIIISWNDESITIEQSYENYILGLAYCLDLKIISEEDFFKEIVRSQYELNKIRSIKLNSIYRINNKYFNSTEDL